MAVWTSAGARGLGGAFSANDAAALQQYQAQQGYMDQLSMLAQFNPYANRVPVVTTAGTPESPAEVAWLRQRVTEITESAFA